MHDCNQLDQFAAAYIDDELSDVVRAAVADHLNACSRCHARVAAERAVRDLVHAQRATLSTLSAPAALRGRCANLVTHRAAPPVVSSWRSRVGPLAFAAMLALLVGGAFLYQMTAKSSQLLAAELTADHVKCFSVNKILGTHQPPTVVESSLSSRFGWQVHLPEEPATVNLELVGARPCLYGEGRVAHIMYRHNGHPVSVFMLPKTVRRTEILDVMGHEAAIWSIDDRTFVLIARESRAEVERLASYIHATLQ